MPPEDTLVKSVNDKIDFLTFQRHGKDIVAAVTAEQAQSVERYQKENPEQEFDYAAEVMKDGTAQIKLTNPKHFEAEILHQANDKQMKRILEGKFNPAFDIADKLDSVKGDSGLDFKVEKDGEVDAKLDAQKIKFLKETSENPEDLKAIFGRLAQDIHVDSTANVVRIAPTENGFPDKDKAAALDDEIKEFKKKAFSIGMSLETGTIPPPVLENSIALSSERLKQLRQKGTFEQSHADEAALYAPQASPAAATPPTRAATKS